MGLAQSLTGPSTTALTVQKERGAAAKMADLLAQDVAGKGEEEEEPLPKKTKKSKGLTISKQCKPAEEKQKTKSIFDLAKAVIELSEDAPDEEAKVDDEVSKTQKRKKGNLSRKTFHPPSHDGERTVTNMTLKGPKKTEKRGVGTSLLMTRVSEAVTLSFCQT